MYPLLIGLKYRPLALNSFFPFLCWIQRFLYTLFCSLSQEIKTTDITSYLFFSSNSSSQDGLDATTSNSRFSAKINKKYKEIFT